MTVSMFYDNEDCVLDLVDQGKVLVESIENSLNSVNEKLYTKENLFNRLVDLERQMATVRSDIKQVKADYTYDEDVNLKGLDKETVKEIAAFAKKFVSESVEKVIEQAEVFKSLKEELTND